MDKRIVLASKRSYSGHSEKIQDIEFKKIKKQTT